jgi:hypothetical protein
VPRRAACGLRARQRAGADCSSGGSTAPGGTGGEERGAAVDRAPDLCCRRALCVPDVAACPEREPDPCPHLAGFGKLHRLVWLKDGERAEILFPSNEVKNDTPISVTLLGGDARIAWRWCTELRAIGALNDQNHALEREVSFPREMNDALIAERAALEASEAADARYAEQKPRCTPKEPGSKILRSIPEGARDLARSIARTDAPS